METKRPFYEPPLRRLLGLPKHNTANDGARALAVGAAVVVAVCGGLGLRGTLPVSLLLPFRLALCGFACAFTGLALQQYAWYTTRTYVDCFYDEQGPLWMIVTFAASLVGAVTFVVAIVCPSTHVRLLILLLLLAVAAGLPRVMALGSLFDGREKDLKVRRGE